MRDIETNRRVHSRPESALPRGSAFGFAARLACGVALSTVVAISLAHGAAAEQSDIVLTASASEVGAMPGSAYAQGYVSMAAADQDAGAFTVAASSAAAAMPDGGTEVIADTPMTEEEIGSVGKCHRC